jgi:hypothetical protein
MSAVLAVTIVQAVILAVSAGVVLYQTRSVARRQGPPSSTKSSRDVMSQRTEAAIPRSRDLLLRPLVAECLPPPGIPRSARLYPWNAGRDVQRLQAAQEQPHRCGDLGVSGYRSPQTGSRGRSRQWGCGVEDQCVQPDFIAAVDELRRRHFRTHQDEGRGQKRSSIQTRPTRLRRSERRAFVYAPPCSRRRPTSSS